MDPAIAEYYEVRLTNPGSPAAIKMRNAIALKNRGLARKVVNELRRTITSLTCEDMEQLGMIGLLKGLERFDPTRGIALSTFLTPWIRGEILHHFRDSSSTLKIPRRWREAYAAMRRATWELFLELGQPPTINEIARQMGTSPERLTQITTAIRCQSPVELAEDKHDIPIEEGAIASEVDLSLEWARLSQRLKKLPEQDWRIVEAVYVERRPRKLVAREAHLDSGTLKRRLQQALGGAAQAIG